jgi:phospholipid transport system substrate-binding protein
MMRRCVLAAFLLLTATAATVARFVLGRYWRVATPAEQQQFQKLFEDYVVFAYAARLSDYGGEIFKVTGDQPDGDGYIVASQIVRQNGEPPLKIDWRLINDNGALKISDVVVEGVSMAVTQRSEFASVIARNGGSINGLLTLMREKTQSAER